MNVIAPVVATNNIRYADFIRITTPSEVYRFSTAPTAITVSAVDALPFSGLGQLVNVGTATRDIKSTANETNITLVGIDTSMLSLVLSAEIKGAQIEMWHGFFDTSNQLLNSGGTGGLYQFFNGYINSFSISEQWSADVRSYVGAITVSASSVQLILQNRVSGRYTNDNSWRFYAPTDSSMVRVNYISTINYYFGKDAPFNK